MQSALFQCSVLGILAIGPPRRRPWIILSSGVAFIFLHPSASGTPQQLSEQVEKSSRNVSGDILKLYLIQISATAFLLPASYTLTRARLCIATSTGQTSMSRDLPGNFRFGLQSINMGRIDGPEVSDTDDILPHMTNGPSKQFPFKAEVQGIAESADMFIRPGHESHPATIYTRKVAV
ncbi:hypothetical protein OIU74_014055 [Salix koriyanagi]|uniref:Uncharacterized protein n=1 Tax=Salix koriyanagi TaxID=2511006 RepID=A0A9Q0SZA9_9ROSI|nr:hypothetical protein OIU74_014055 [Salix koriyanagi]